MSFLNGYKTYIVAGVTLAYALIDAWSHGSLSQADIGLIMGALGGASIRHGITTSAK